MYKIFIAFFISVLSLTGQKTFTGFFDFTYDEDSGLLKLYVPESRLGQDFLYVNSLSGGIGSNDIGLDRGQLGEDRIVKFLKAGNKILLIQPNLEYRAVSENLLERKAVEEAFAQSVIWGFEIVEKKEGMLIIDMTKFLLRDAHGVAERLESRKQGKYKLEESRSAIWMDRTRAFPENCEFDALLTFVGDGTGRWIKSVAPDAKAVTVSQHHSFIALPDDQYKPRIFHPYSGFNQLKYYDYASPIEESLEKRFIHRHRLKKKDPQARISEAVEPIVYYIDPGCPEPVKSALMEGTAWWDQAFQAAGYAPGTFQIKELPAGADMLDVRYNVIQWVHRSTRGWSYGSSISDPRTGEILKGHVSLGSLRVRQDFLIAQGILSPYNEGEEDHSRMKELALARLRQLAAHEVGHTIGLSHNFASSFNNRASVMDYPHPMILLKDGQFDLSKAYDRGIGEWDKISISYGYQDFAPSVDENAALHQMILNAQKEGWLFISDSDSRPKGGAHPHGHLWDNGPDAVVEFERLLTVRKKALEGFGEASIPSGTPLSELEKVLVPMYLMHRYQLEAVSKLIGGLNYQYYVKGDAYDHTLSPVSVDIQGKAIHAILHSVSADQLKLPERIIQLIPPPSQGYRRDQETFSGRTNLVFDPLSPAESYANTAFEFLLDNDRLARVYRQNATGQSPIELESFLNQISTHIYSQPGTDKYSLALNQMVQKVFFIHLLNLAFDDKVDVQVGALTYGELLKIKNKFLDKSSTENSAHYLYLNRLLREAENQTGLFKIPSLKELPPGSPIGCENEW